MALNSSYAIFAYPNRSVVCVVRTFCKHIVFDLIICPGFSAFLLFCRQSLFDMSPRGLFGSRLYACVSPFLLNPYLDCQMTECCSPIRRQDSAWNKNLLRTPPEKIISDPITFNPRILWAPKQKKATCARPPRIGKLRFDFRCLDSD